MPAPPPSPLCASMCETQAKIAKPFLLSKFQTLAILGLNFIIGGVDAEINCLKKCEIEFSQSLSGLRKEGAGERRVVNFV
jgi:hypothetical protein